MNPRPSIRHRLNEKGEAGRPDAKEANHMDNGAIVHIDYDLYEVCLLYTSPSPRDATLSRMPSSA